jgi:TRAP-type C4-dicarboxylate transport system permease large subunit
MLLVIAVFAASRKYPGEESVYRPAFLKVILSLLLPVIILLSIGIGLFTPTEAVAIAVAYSLFLGLFVFRTLNIRIIGNALAETAAETGTIGLVLAAGSVFAFALAQQRLIPQTIAAFPLPLIVIFLIVIGMFVETLSAIVIFVPLLLPLANTAGINPIHFGVVITLSLMTGALVRRSALLIASQTGKISVPVRTLFPWVLTLFLALLLIIYIPEISLIIPMKLGFV